jgi:transcription initiation factor TFIIIB Brf1 subunit/transcription initiation factor TFIIB
VADLLDVFNGLGRLGSQVTETWSRQKKYIQDKTYSAQAFNLSKTQNEILLKAQDFQNDPGGYADYMNREFDKWYEGAQKAGDGSRYYLDNIGRLARESRLGLERQLFQTGVQLERGKALAAMADEDQRLSNLDPDAGLGMRVLNYREAYDAGVINDTQQQKLESQAVAETFTRLIDPSEYLRQNSGAGTRQWLDHAAGILADGRFDGVENRDKTHKYAVAEGVRQIYERNFNEISLADAQYKDLLKLAAAGGPGSAGAYSAAMAIKQKWRDVKYGIRGNSEYAEDKKDQIALMFPPDKPENGFGFGFGELKKLIPGYRTRAILDIARQAEADGGQVTFEKGFLRFQNKVYDVIAQSGLDFDTGMALFEDAADFAGFYRDVAKTIAEVNPAWHKSIIEPAAMYFDGLTAQAKKENNLDDAAFYNSQAGKAMQTLYDIYTGTFGNDLKSEDYQGIMKNLTAGLIAGDTYWRAARNGESRYTGRESKDLAKMTRFLEENPAFLTTVNTGPKQETVVWDETSYNTYQAQLKDEFRTILRVGDGNIAPLGNEEEGQDDFSGTVLFTVTGAGGKDGIYKFVSDINEAGKLKGQVLMKKTASGGWEPYSEKTGAESRKEDYSAAAEEASRVKNERNYSSFKDELKKLRDMDISGQDEYARNHMAGELQNRFMANGLPSDSRKYIYTDEDWVENGMMPGGNHENITSGSIKNAQTRENLLATQKKILDRLTDIDRAELLRLWKSWGVPVLYDGSKE